ARSSRYTRISRGTTTRLGMSAAVLSPVTVGLPRRVAQVARPAPLRTGGHPPLPPFSLPHPARLSPHPRAARRHALDWAAAMGMLGDLWNPELLRGFDFAYCAAMLHAGADPDGLNLSTDWLTWGTYADDVYPVRYGRAGDVAGARAQNARLSLFMPPHPGPTPVPENPIERGLADLWRRTAPAARARCRAAVEQMIEAWLWELVNQA